MWELDSDSGWNIDSMYNILYKLYYKFQRSERHRKDIGKKSSKFIVWVLGQIEAYYNIRVKDKYIKEDSKAVGITEKKREQKIIVSLTSYPKRINDLWITVETLLRQTMKPDEIILWLAEEQFDGEESLPPRLLAQRTRGLTIRWCDNLMSHKKYFYTMQEYPDDLIILVDDDFFYPYDMVKQLFIAHDKYPKDIICFSPAIIYPSLDTPPSLWTRAKANQRIEGVSWVQPFTGAGSLYPPAVMPKETFDKDKMKTLCPYADDLWLKFMSMWTETRVSCVYKCRSFPITIYGTAESSLWHINGAEKKNDEQWQALINEYHEEYLKMKTIYEK